MKVAFLVDGSLDQISGGYVYDRRLVDHLRSQGDQVEVLSLPAGSYLRRWRTNFDARLLSRLVDMDADIVLEDELSHPGLLRLNSSLRRQWSAPIVTIVHHLRSSEPAAWPLPAVYASVERAYLRSVDGFVFNSRATRRAVENLMGDAAPAIVAPPAGDRLRPSLTDEAIQRRTHETGPLRLLFVGNLIRRKGLLTLLDGLAALPASLVKLTVVGDAAFEPAHAAAVRRRIDRGRLGDRVELLGPLYDDRLASRMADSHVLVVPSLYEGFGIVYLEAMGFGLPAIGGTAGGAAEIIREGENGFLVQPGDSHTLTERLRLLAQDRSRLEVMSLAAHRTYRAQPTWARTGDVIRQFLVESLRRPVIHSFPMAKEESI
jgi:glycosyltransferase involved in cell wall biosynthesis